jgi:hypothetical protein
MPDRLLRATRVVQPPRPALSIQSEITPGCHPPRELASATMEEAVHCSECGCSVPPSPLLHVRTHPLPDGFEGIELLCPTCAAELEAEAA